MKPAAYFNRIRYNGPVRPDLATLRALHRAHQLAVPFENLDVQLGRSLGLDVGAAYEKIVDRRRGGWCYEMNGVFGSILESLGFDVTRMTAGVMREKLGDVQLGNHLCLLVRIDQPYLVDVGFGGSLAEPLPLRATQRIDAPYAITLGEIGGYWRFSERFAEQPDDETFSFDFRVDAADEALLSKKCIYLQTNADSPFIQNLVVQRRTADTHLSLRGRVLSISYANRVNKSILNSGEELVATLRDRFDLDVPEAAGLWPIICARHESLFSKS